MQYTVIENCFLEDMSAFEVPSFEANSIVELTDEQALELEGMVELIQDTPPAQESEEDGEVPPTPPIEEGAEPTVTEETKPVTEENAPEAIKESETASTNEGAPATQGEDAPVAEEETPKASWAGGHTV